MRELKINLQYQEPIDPRVLVWKKRLYVVFVLLVVGTLTAGVGLFVFNRTIMSRSEKLEAEEEKLITAIEQKEILEGTYLTLVDRLNAIIKFRKSKILNEIPAIALDLLPESIVVSSMEVGHGNLSLNLLAGDASQVEAVITAFRGYESEDIEFSDPVIRDTSIDETGEYVLEADYEIKQD